MHRIPARRWLAAVGAAGALIGVTALPAGAAPPEDQQFRVFLQPATIAADGPGAERFITFLGAEGTTLDNLRVTVDYTDLAGVADVNTDSDDPPCTDTAGVITCVFDDPVDISGGISAIRVAVEPASGASVDDTGDIVLTATADGATTSTYTSRVTVGEGVDLAAGADVVELSARFGANLPVPLSVGNVGPTAVSGVVAVLFNDFSVKRGSNHSNCRYGTFVTACEFGTTLRPGSGYTASLTTRIGPDVLAPGDTSPRLTWVTAAEWDDLAALLDVFGQRPATAGAGPALTLTESAGSPSALAQTDTEPVNNATTYQVSITGTNAPDLAVAGATVSGTVGATVPVAVSVRNKGPVTLDNSGPGGPGVSVRILVPPGTSVTEIADSCYPLATTEPFLPDFGSPGEPGARSYVCGSEGSVFPRGATAQFTFRLRIDEVITNATGEVRLSDSAGQDRSDAVPADNSAKIIVNPLVDGGAGLPVTGDNTVLIVAGGAALVVLGMVGYLLARRRRVRFVA